MAVELYALAIAGRQPRRLAAFWSGVLGWSVGGDPLDGAAALVPSDDTGFRLRFLPGAAPKVRVNRVHFDLTSSSLEDQQARVRKALELGGRHFDVGQLPDEEHVVLADPEDNEFCVIEPGNGFLADCGLVGALAGDGSQEVGHFWSKALGWPLVWDQDEETAIRSPHGGPKLTWAGPPVAPKHGENRIHLDLAVRAGDDLEAEADRLVSLGATRVGASRDLDGLALRDPDDNEFCLTSTRDTGGNRTDRS